MVIITHTFLAAFPHAKTTNPKHFLIRGCLPIPIIWHTQRPAGRPDAVHHTGGHARTAMVHFKYIGISTPAWSSYMTSPDGPSSAGIKISSAGIDPRHQAAASVNTIHPSTTKPKQQALLIIMYSSPTSHAAIICHCCLVQLPCSTYQ